MRHSFTHGATATTPNRRQLGKLALASAGITLAASSGLSAAQATSSDIRSVSTAQRNHDAQKLLDLINTYRSQKGLSRLNHSATIASVMDSEARRQFVQGYYSHGTEFIYNAKVRGYSFVREVIALTYNDDIGQLLAFWKSSPAHNAAILAPAANTLGIGLAYGHGTGLPWRILGNVGIYRYDGTSGPGDIRSNISSGAQAGPAGYTLRGAISEKYYALGGETRFGAPTMNESGGLTNGGAYQMFQTTGGQVYKFMWSPATGAHPVYQNGAIGQLWMRAGHENGYGYPVMSEYVGLAEGGAYQTFRTNNKVFKLLWHPTHGAHAVEETGGIGQAWIRAGYENGYGYPVTGEYRSGAEVHQRFSRGVTLAWHSVTGRVRTV